MLESSTDQTVEKALEVADSSVERVLDGIRHGLRRQAREETLATLLAAGLYAEGAHIARHIGFDESHVFDLLMQSADISDDDEFMVSESVYGLQSRLDLV
jgi:hypothetical protein